MKKHKSPRLAVDAIIEYKGGIVLINRKNPPYGWALPGGFVEEGEKVEDAVQREVKEETSLDLEDLEQFKVYSSPERDPRFHVVSVVFTAKGKGKLKGGDDAKDIKVFTKATLPKEIAFDHRTILEDYFKKEYTEEHARSGIDAKLPEIKCWPNQSKEDYKITIEVPEYTSLCPKTHLPDFGKIIIEYIPDKLCVELKSFKYYILGYRNLGIFYENAVNKILDDFVKACKPKWAKIKGIFNPRGGMSTLIEREYRKK